MGKAEYPNTTTDKLAHSKDGVIFLQVGRGLSLGSHPCEPQNAWIDIREMAQLISKSQTRVQTQNPVNVICDAVCLQSHTHRMYALVPDGKLTTSVHKTYTPSHVL